MKYEVVYDFILYIYIYIYILEIRSSVIEKAHWIWRIKSKTSGFVKKCSLQGSESRAQITREFQVFNTLGINNKAFTWFVNKVISISSLRNLY